MNETKAFTVDIGENDTDGNKPQDKPHNNNPISMMEISPNGKYLVTYSEKDKTIVGWDVESRDIIEDEKCNQCNHELNYPVNGEKIFQMCVSNEKILAYINNKYEISKYKDIFINL